MGKNIAAKVPELDRHFAYFTYEQSLANFKKYGWGDTNLVLLIG